MCFWDRWLWALGFAVCHQRPERILRFGERALFLCARDTGIYTAFFTVVLGLSLLRKDKRAGIPPLPVLLLGAAGLLFLGWEGLTGYLGWRESSNLLRFLSGYAGGAGLAFPVAALLNREVWRGDADLKVMGDGRDVLIATTSAVPSLVLYLLRPDWLFPLGQLWLLVCMLGTLWSLNLLLVCLLKPIKEGGGIISRAAAASLLVLLELSGSYLLHRWLRGAGPGLPPGAAPRFTTLSHDVRRPGKVLGRVLLYIGLAVESKPSR